MIRKSRMLELAEIARKHLTQSKRRDRDEMYYHQTDDAPEWVNAMCRDAHSGILPEDYKYRFIVEALDALIEAEGDRDNVNLESDIYTSDLTAWLASHNERIEYVNQAIQGFGANDDIVDMLITGQLIEKQEVFDSIVNSLIVADKEVA